MKKRGQIILKGITSLIIFVMVVVAFTKAGEAYGTLEAFYKLALAKDLALTIDLIYSFDGDMQYKYPNEVSDYGIEVRENHVRVYKRNLGKSDSTAGFYRFAGLASDYVNAKVEGKRFVMFEKIGPHLQVKGVDE